MGVLSLVLIMMKYTKQQRVKVQLCYLLHQTMCQICKEVHKHGEKMQFLVGQKRKIGWLLVSRFGRVIYCSITDQYFVCVTNKRRLTN
jgi:hypothetical protein